MFRDHGNRRLNLFVIPLVLDVEFDGIVRGIGLHGFVFISDTYRNRLVFRVAGVIDSSAHHNLVAILHC